MKFSIVVPTRNRCEFLKYCLQTCLLSNDRDLEVIVSDNNSVDETETVVSNFGDPRLKYVNPGRDVSMRQNFEFALSHATGDYIIFIGDDDGVLPNGLVTLRYLIEKHKADILLWRHITYIWPHREPVPHDGILKFRYRDFCGPLYEWDGMQVFEEFCQAKRTSYRDGANIYHGCVSRSVIEAVKAKGGVYFQGQIPDVNTAISNLTAANSILWMRNPVTIAGAGEKSNGTAMNSVNRASQKQKEIVSNFTSLALEDSVEPEIDLKVRSIVGYAYANLDRVNKMHLDGRHQINHTLWQQKTIEDMRKYPKEHRCWDILEAFFSDIDSNYKYRGLSESEAVEEEQENTPAVSVTSKHKVNKPLPSNLKNVATIAEWLQGVTGEPYFPSKNVPVTLIKQGLRSFDMKRNLKNIASANNSTN
jgi:glycosyltransferase involved in cell wall biosynthesis